MLRFTSFYLTMNDLEFSCKLSYLRKKVSNMGRLWSSSAGAINGNNICGANNKQSMVMQEPSELGHARVGPLRRAAPCRYRYSTTLKQTSTYPVKVPSPWHTVCLPQPTDMGAQGRARNPLVSVRPSGRRTLYSNPCQLSCSLSLSFSSSMSPSSSIIVYSPLM